jgi:hypothetical protein
VRGALSILPEDVACKPTGPIGLQLPSFDLAAQAVCAPKDPPELGGWTTSPDCRTPNVFASPRCDPKPFVYDGMFRRVGPPVETDVWLYFFGGICTMVGLELPDTVFHAVGEAVPHQSFPRLKVARSPAGAVDRLGWVARDGGPVLLDPTIGWSDPVAGSSRVCTPTLFEEGTVLCAPPGTGFEPGPTFSADGAFPDPSCCPE